jgi:hypothetical protein
MAYKRGTGEKGPRNSYGDSEKLLKPMDSTKVIQTLVHEHNSFDAMD